MSKRVYEIDGDNFSSLEEFAREFSEKLELEIYWHGNLDALNDILHGGFGTPNEGFILVWKNSTLSKVRLGYEETVRQLEKRLERCHPTNRKYVKLQLEKAKQHKSATIFDWLIEIMEDKTHNDIELILD